MDRIAYILAYLTKIYYFILGALKGRKLYNIFWSKGKEPSLYTIKDLEKWFNKRLLKGSYKLVFSSSKLVLYYLNIAP
jgi:hypothetical protein